MQQAGVSIDATAWQAVGMAGSSSVDVTFDGARADAVGTPGAYLARPGFWHGGAGIAACWHGAACALGAALWRRLNASTEGGSGHAFQLAALGRIDLHLRSSAALLTEAAAWIDRHPNEDASEAVLRVRLAAEQAAARTLEEVGRALGATPFCRDAHFAQLAADLPVFIRQSHAERDLATLGERVAQQSDTRWLL